MFRSSNRGSFSYDVRHFPQRTSNQGKKERTVNFVRRVSLVESPFISYERHFPCAIFRAPFSATDEQSRKKERIVKSIRAQDGQGKVPRTVITCILLETGFVCACIALSDFFLLVLKGHLTPNKKKQHSVVQARLDYSLLFP